MKIAFTSCSNSKRYPNQPGWKRIAEAKPDALLLLGDQIYMDFGLRMFGGNLYEPVGLNLQAFGERMYSCYQGQFNEPNFRRLREEFPNMVIAATWDDHDFAWNNACGGRIGKTKKDIEKHKVPDDRRWLSRILFQQYLTALRNRLQNYPEAPVRFSELPLNPMPESEGIQEALSLGGDPLRIVMLDTRYQRDCLSANAPQILGESQWEWLRNEIAGSQDITLICSSTTLSDGECWEKDYPDSWSTLQEITTGRKVLVLSGDIHKNVFHSHANSVNDVLPRIDGSLDLD